MAIRNLWGYKGSTRTYMAPVSESRFSGDKFEFKDSGSNAMNYVMNNVAGEAQYKNEVMNLDQGNKRYQHESQIFSGLSYAEVSSTQEFSPTLHGYKMKSGTIEVKVNGVDLMSNEDQSVSADSEFYTSGDSGKVRIKTPYGSNGRVLGITLIDRDRVEIKFQQERP